ncbi:hypothetical protein J1N09_03285 [Aureitalea sp. L0-47]|uniref:hypothetical protein n=1 Tax=Aureitalea sp. L0-47 TaxID=2816962 RepID=UPI002238042C|nr:hypothetical protein [Aureitalea sp. L0-47]MCW5518846.1 hypothetical protein [Aureitalea sp. L0-47]
MKRTAALLILTFATLISSSLKAQGVFNDPETDTYISQKAITPPDHGYKFTGSPYADKRFQQGFVFRDGVILASNVGLRFNALRDEFEIKKSLNTSNYAAKVLVKSEDIYVKIMNRLFVFLDKNEETGAGGYYEVLFEGESLSLYKKLTKDFIEGKKAINSIATDILPMYKEKEALFLLNENKELVELPGSKNGKVNSLGSNKKQIKQYIRDKDLNINKNYDLIKLLRYYDSL